jgi:hypothetical protein
MHTIPIKWKKKTLKFVPEDLICWICWTACYYYLHNLCTSSPKYEILSRSGDFCLYKRAICSFWGEESLTGSGQRHNINLPNLQQQETRWGEGAQLLSARLGDHKCYKLATFTYYSYAADLQARWLNLNSVNQLIVVMVKCGVLFEVRTRLLNNV